MKKLILLFILIPSISHATTFTGDITLTANHAVFESFWNYFDPNETWSLQYSYESDSIDGTFNEVTVTKEGIQFPTTIELMTVNDSTIQFLGIQSWNVWNIMYSDGIGGWSMDRIGGGSFIVSNPIEVREDLNTGLFLLIGLYIIRRITR